MIAGHRADERQPGEERGQTDCFTSQEPDVPSVPAFPPGLSSSFWWLQSHSQPTRWRLPAHFFMEDRTFLDGVSYAAPGLPAKCPNEGRDCFLESLKLATTHGHVTGYCHSSTASEGESERVLAGPRVALNCLSA